MGKCMSKDQMHESMIQHISSPVRTDDGIGFALGRLSSVHTTRWVKYEDSAPSEDEKPVVSEGQLLRTRSGSRSYGLTYPQGHLVSCAAFGLSGSRRESKECSCGTRRQSEGSRLPASINSPVKKQSLAIIQKLTPITKAVEPRITSRDVENIGAKPTKLAFNSPAKTRPALRETNANVPSEVVGPKPRRPAKDQRENVPVEDMLPRRQTPKPSARPSLTEKEFQALDTNSEPMNSPGLVVESRDEENLPPEKTVTLVGTESSPLQSILSVISDPDSSSLVEVVLSKANISQTRCTELERSKATDFKTIVPSVSDDSDTESSLGAIDIDTPSKKSSDQSEDEGSTDTPVAARSVRSRLSLGADFCSEDKPLHWKASALYTNCLFEESPAKSIVKSAEKKTPVGLTKFSLGHVSDYDAQLRLQDLAPGQEMRRMSVDGVGSSAATVTPLRRLVSPTVKELADEELESCTKDIEIVTPTSACNRADDGIAPDVKAFLQSSKKVVLSLGPESGSTSKPFPSEFQTLSGAKEMFSSNSLAAVLELEALLVTSDVRRESGHGVEGLQIVGAELTELFSSSGGPPSLDGHPTETCSSRTQSQLPNQIYISPCALPKSEASPALSCPSGNRFVGKVGTSAGEPVRCRMGNMLHSPESSMSETFELKSLEIDSATSKDPRHVAPSASAVTDEYSNGTNLIHAPLNQKSGTHVAASEMFTRGSSPGKFRGLSTSGGSLSLEDFQIMIEAAEREERLATGAEAGSNTWSGNTLSTISMSFLQKLRDSLPPTPSSSLPSTPKLSAASTPRISKASTPGTHANCVALTP